MLNCKTFARHNFSSEVLDKLDALQNPGWTPDLGFAPASLAFIIQNESKLYGVYYAEGYHATVAELDGELIL